MNGVIFFIVLPYLALISLIFGSIYRYFFRGFQVSSLSSQILESRLLFFGSRPFHWGIITLLIGHLIGLLFPSGVLAWNGKPVRLYILEITAFAFGILALIGLIILIVRRSDISRIRRVTTKMDIFAFLVLTVTIITGLLTAFFLRWGSSWFALVMAPYLKSILIFKPDVTAVTALPVLAKIHFISTFVFFGIFPFTRFIHIIVYPFSYVWREYQVVIWNKRKKID
jgi:nitrate reductase gamma subunit